MAVGQQITPAVQLDQQLDLWAEPSRDGGKLLLERLRSAGEVDPRRQRHRYYALLPSGELRQWTGNIGAMPLVGTLDPSYYADPSKLINAQPTEIVVTAAVDATGKLTVAPPAGFVGDHPRDGHGLGWAHERLDVLYAARRDAAERGDQSGRHSVDGDDARGPASSAGRGSPRRQPIPTSRRSACW